MIKIDRSDKQKALAELKKTEIIIKNGVSLVLFPEGTRNVTKAPLLPFKKGAFMMSLNTKQDLLAITVNHSNNILQGWSIKPIAVNIHFHKPLSPALYENNRSQFMEDTRQNILSKLEE